MIKHSTACAALTTLFLLPAAGRADACTIIVGLGNGGWPENNVARLSGVVSGYVTGNGSIGEVHRPPGLRVQIDTVVTGGLRSNDVGVYPLSLGPNCDDGPTPLSNLERQFPVGTRVVVRGEVMGWPDAAVAVTGNKGGFVRVFLNAERTPEGDLDFERSGSVDPQFAHFEFDRAVLTVGMSPPGQRQARLRNLARYPGLRYIWDARGFYRQLLVESGLPDSQQLNLLAFFDELVRNPR